MNHSNPNCVDARGYLPKNQGRVGGAPSLERHWRVVLAKHRRYERIAHRQTSMTQDQQTAKSDADHAKTLALAKEVLKTPRIVTRAAKHIASMEASKAHRRRVEYMKWSRETYHPT